MRTRVLLDCTLVIFFPDIMLPPLSILSCNFLNNMILGIFDFLLPDDPSYCSLRRLFFLPPDLNKDEIIIFHPSHRNYTTVQIRSRICGYPVPIGAEEFRSLLYMSVPSTVPSVRLLGVLVPLKYVSLCVLVVQMSMMVLALRGSRQSSDPYISSTAVFLSEIVKLLTCLCLVFNGMRCLFPVTTKI